MSGGIFCRFTVGRAGVGAENVHYITRLSATGGDADSLYLHNYPAHISAAKDYDELRKRMVEYNRQREQDELTTKRRGGGQTRTHYRCKLSFEKKVDTEKALGMAREYLAKDFPEAVATAAVHQDTRHTHVHINLQARLTNERKLRLDDRKYKSLDTAWGRIYGREFGHEKLRQHELKKEEMREWKREYAEAKSRGKELQRSAPERHHRELRAFKAEEHQARERRNYGVDETRTGGDQRQAPTQAERDGAREQTAESVVEASQRATRAANGAVHGIEQLRRDVAQLGERARGWEREEGGIER